MIRLDDRVWILWAIFLLLLPWNWLAGVISAACVHEISHIIVLRIAGGRIRSVAVMPFGAVIYAEGISGWKEVFVSLAGPLGSFLAVLFIRYFPIFGLCALIHGFFNLVPVYPLDGGRIVASLLQILCPKHAPLLGKWIPFLAVIVLLLVFILLFGRYAWKIWPVLICAVITIRSGSRKIP